MRYVRIHPRLPESVDILKFRVGEKAIKFTRKWVAMPDHEIESLKEPIQENELQVVDYFDKQRIDIKEQFKEQPKEQDTDVSRFIRCIVNETYGEKQDTIMQELYEIGDIVESQKDNETITEKPATEGAMPRKKIDNRYIPRKRKTAFFGAHVSTIPSVKDFIATVVKLLTTSALGIKSVAPVIESTNNSCADNEISNTQDGSTIKIELDTAATLNRPGPVLVPSMIGYYSNEVEGKEAIAASNKSDVKAHYRPMDQRNEVEGGQEPIISEKLTLGAVMAFIVSFMWVALVAFQALVVGVIYIYLHK